MYTYLRKENITVKRLKHSVPYFLFFFRISFFTLEYLCVYNAILCIVALYPDKCFSLPSENLGFFFCTLLIMYTICNTYNVYNINVYSTAYE